jgi:PAP2 superfamily
MKKLANFASKLLLALGLAACQSTNQDYQTAANNPEFLRRSVIALTDVIIHDVFSPPVAARIYTYASVAAYEAIVPAYPSYQSLAGKLNGLAPPPAPVAGEEYCFPLASTQAFLTTAQGLIFSKDKLIALEQQLHREFEAAGLPTAVFDRSVAHGRAVAAHVMAWAATDNYKQTRSYPKYTVLPDQEKWKPTPPGYQEAVEPNWNKIRPFAIDSAAQFTPPRPPVYSRQPNSEFYKLAQEVYRTGGALTPEQEAIARFWDCNPFALNLVGHVAFATKKITPGGHWMSIAGIASRQSQAHFAQTAEAFALTALALVDGFISCWDEKYRSQVVRPETYINELIDPQWVPLLQTPPFPEYTSGHSVISAASATVLAKVFGENFSYQDTTQNRFALPPRRFTSFGQAADEASVSRLYGGIHYRPAIELGAAQGRQVGEQVWAKARTRR